MDQRLGAVPVTSNFRTSRRSGSTSRPSSILLFVPSRSVRAVATTGRFVVWSRRRVNCRPMPREAGEVKIQGCTIVSSGLEMQPRWTMGDCLTKGSREPCLLLCCEMTYFVRIDRAWRIVEIDVRLSGLCYLKSLGGLLNYSTFNTDLITD